MHPSCLPCQTFAGSLLAACRVVGLIAVLTVAVGGALGFAVSLYMAQVFDRVTTVRTAAMQPVPALHLAVMRDGL